ncbi:MAG: hypothetical protein RL757_2454 [Bacteroidota bacterium]|jgi:hypothetical protein
MKKIIMLFVLFYVTINMATAQRYFNKLYRFEDSIAVGNFGLVASDTMLYTTGVTTRPIRVGNRNLFLNVGFFAKFSTNGGNLQQVVKLVNPDTPITNELWRNTGVLNHKKQIVTIASHRDTFFYQSLLALDLNGNIVLEKRLYPSSHTGATGIDLALSSNCITHDNGYIMGGSQLMSNNNIYATLIKVDSIGHERWRKFIVDPWYSQQSDRAIIASKIHKISDNKYYVLMVKGIIGGNYQTYSVVTMDSLGNFTGEYTINPTTSKVVNATALTRDSALIVVGNVNDSINPRKVNAYIAKIKDNQLIWEKSISAYGFTSVIKVREIANGELLLAGEQGIRFPRDTSLPQDSINFAGMLVKLDKNGNFIWGRHYVRGSYHPQGVPVHRFTNVDIIPSDSSIALAGYLEDYRFASPTYGQFGWLLRVDKYGCLTEGCQLTSLSQPPPQYNVPVSVFPNPAQDRVTFKLPPFGGIEGGQGKLMLFDVSGRLVLQQSLSPLWGVGGASIDVSALPNSMYLYKIQFDNGAQAVGKLVVAR